MAVRFDSFCLSEMTAKPEDAFRLASLAMVEGQRVQGYGGDYYRYYMGDAMAVVRTMLDPESGEEILLGMDTHAVSKCQWTCRVERDLTDEGADVLQRRLLVRGESGEDCAVVDVLCADVLPVMEAGSVLRLNMAGFPLRVDYSEGVCKGVVSAQEDTVLLEGVVKDAKVGESYLGMEPLTKFLSVTASVPPHGDGEKEPDGEHQAGGCGLGAVPSVRRRGSGGVCRGDRVQRGELPDCPAGIFPEGGRAAAAACSAQRLRVYVPGQPAGGGGKRPGSAGYGRRAAAGGRVYGVRAGAADGRGPGKPAVHGQDGAAVPAAGQRAGRLCLCVPGGDGQPGPGLGGFDYQRQPVRLRAGLG